MKHSIKIAYLPLIILSLSILLLWSSCKKENQNTDQVKLVVTDAVKLKTLEVQNITNTSAESGGNITDDGGKKILAKGICWSTNPRPLIGDENTTYTDEGEDHDAFTSTLSNLQPGTTYYMRAYATTNEGTAYGNEIEFITTGQGPGSYKLYTEIIDVANLSASFSTQIKIDTTIEQYGVCWNTSPNPTWFHSKTEDGNLGSSFNSEVTGLLSGTKYYLRAYLLTQDNGLIYGNEIEFTTVYEIGQTGPAGGYVFYDKGDTIGGWRYLEAAPQDLEKSYEWGCYNTLINGADGLKVGDGQQNTADILAGCATENIAADACNDYVLNGYDDWFLPSLDELALMNNNLHMNGKGGFIDQDDRYWSSSEVSNEGAIAFMFIAIQEGGFYWENSKADLSLIRPARAFK